jgi:hypothetical protein
MVNERGGKMKIKSLLFVICHLSFVILFLSGCGGNGPGSPGSTGTEDTGIVLNATIVPVYKGVNTNSVDAFQGICCGSTEIAAGGTCSSGTSTVEFFADHEATVTINANLLNPSAKFTPGNIYIEKYTVEFRRSTDSIGAPPIETIVDGTVGMPVVITFTPPVGDGVVTVTTTVTLVDLIRKIKYAADINSGVFTSNELNNYTAIYTFEGKNDFGDAFTFKAETGFEIGDFNNCGG